MNANKLLMFAGIIGLTGAVVAGTTTDPAWEAGADIVIAKGDTVILSASTPEFNSLSVAGGRIALWAGREWSDTVKEKRLTRSETSVGACTGFLGDISAGCGISKNPDKTKKTSRHGEWNNWGDDGTVRYVSVDPDPGLMLMLR